MPRGIDRWSEEPYYRQLASILRREIRAGHPAPGEALPSEPQLMRAHGVSRGTVRQALEVLRDEGYVQTVHRRGSRVRPREDWQA